MRASGWAYSEVEVSLGFAALKVLFGHIECSVVLRELGLTAQHFLQKVFLRLAVEVVDHHSHPGCLLVVNLGGNYAVFARVAPHFRLYEGLVRPTENLPSVSTTFLPFKID